MNNKLNRTFLIIILLEGYVVLAAELLAIRQTIPFVGNGPESIAIIISAVLLPLAAGYYVGGHALEWATMTGMRLSIRRRINRNVLIAAAFYILGLSYMTLACFFYGLDELGFKSRLIQTLIYSGLFLVVPTYLLGQTAPLISHYYSKRKVPQVTGRVLFFSTLGSFLGSILSTLIFMSLLGVNITVMITLSLLLSITLIINPVRHPPGIVALMILLASGIYLNSSAAMRAMNMVANNQYNNIQIMDAPEENAKILSVNGASSSKYAPDISDRFEYTQYIEKHFINTIEGSQPKNILIIGAAGFTLGIDDTLNNYVFVDIDPDMKALSETYFIQRSLGPNKQFEAVPARAFLRRNKKKFDLIVVDAYAGVHNIPLQLLTIEFYRSVKQALAKEGIVIANIITHPMYKTDYSARIDNTLRNVFGHITRQIMGDINPWAGDELKNILYIYQNRVPIMGTYTDNKNAYFWDR